MKKVLSNSSEVAHVFAQRNQSEGRTGTGHLYFSDSVLYSYGSHFPLAIFLDDKKKGTRLILNNDRYSVTTSKHQHEVRYACNHYTFINTNTAVMKVLADNVRYGWKANSKGEAIKHVSEYVTRALVGAAKKAASRRKVELKAADIAAGVEVYNEAKSLLDYLGYAMPAHITRLYQTLQNDYSTVISQNAKAIAAAKRKEDKRRKEAYARVQKEAREALSAWRSGESKHSTVYALENVALRINGDNIETTKGAVFPLEHGRMAFPFIKAVLGKGWERGSHTIHLGHYQIDKILPDGTVIAGCHTVPYSEVELVAKQLNIL